MKKITDYLTKKEQELQRIADQAEIALRTCPEGSIHISTSRGIPRFYHVFVKDGKKQRVYLKKENQELIKALAQKDFDSRLLQATKQQQNIIRNFMSHFDLNEVYGLYSELPEVRKEIVQAGNLNTEEFVRRWESVAYVPGTFEEGDPEFYTLKNERVRSKSEQIIADRLNRFKIPYRYEFPWKTKDGKVIRPDFMLLDTESREVYIFEHFGRMDDSNYVNRNYIPKMQTYIANGIFPGEQLLFTMESMQCPFSIVTFEKLIQHYFPNANLEN